MRVTVSAIKADVGGIGGHTRPSDALLEAVRRAVAASDIPLDHYVGYCGDDVVFAADKTEPGAFNYPLYRVFADSLSNTGLIVNASLASGVTIDVMDVEEGKVASLSLWEDKPAIEAALMYPGRYVIESVRTRSGEPILAASTDRLHNIAGTYVGKDDPICVMRTQKLFPATEEAGSAFSNPHYVAGNTRGSHNMPLMPVRLNTAASINFCIPIVSALVFSMRGGRLTGPFDGFSTPDWDARGAGRRGRRAPRAVRGSRLAPPRRPRMRRHGAPARPPAPAAAGAPWAPRGICATLGRPAAGPPGRAGRSAGVCGRAAFPAKTPRSRGRGTPARGACGRAPPRAARARFLTAGARAGAQCRCS